MGGWSVDRVLVVAMKMVVVVLECSMTAPTPRRYTGREQRRRKEKKDRERPRSAEKIRGRE